MSEANKAALEEARKPDGKFGTQTHSVPDIEPLAWNSADVKLEIGIPAIDFSWEAYDGLPEWPKSQPKPSVYWEYDDGKPVVHLTVGEESCKFWAGSDGGVFNTAQTYGGSWVNIMDGEELDAAVEYGDAVYERIDGAAYAVATATAMTPEVHGAIADFATAGPGQTVTQEKVPTSGPAFQAEMTRLAEVEDEARARRQHGCMISALLEAKTDSPNVASFTLTVDKYLEVERGTALDADGNHVGDDEEEALSKVLSTWGEDDLSRYVGSDVDIQEILDTW